MLPCIEMAIVEEPTRRELERKLTATWRACVRINAARIIEDAAHNRDVGGELKTRLGRSTSRVLHVVGVEEVQDRIDDCLRRVAGQINSGNVLCIELSS